MEELVEWRTSAEEEINGFRQRERNTNNALADSDRAEVLKKQWRVLFTRVLVRDYVTKFQASKLVRGLVHDTTNLLTTIREAESEDRRHSGAIGGTKPTLLSPLRPQVEEADKFSNSKSKEGLVRKLDMRSYLQELTGLTETLCVKVVACQEREARWRQTSLAFVSRNNELAEELARSREDNKDYHRAVERLSKQKRLLEAIKAPHPSSNIRKLPPRTVPVRNPPMGRRSPSPHLNALVAGTARKAPKSRPSTSPKPRDSGPDDSFFAYVRGPNERRISRSPRTIPNGADGARGDGRKESSTSPNSFGTSFNFKIKAMYDSRVEEMEGAFAKQEMAFKARLRELAVELKRKDEDLSRRRRDRDQHMAVLDSVKQKNTHRSPTNKAATPKKTKTSGVDFDRLYNVSPRKRKLKVNSSRTHSETAPRSQVAPGTSRSHSAADSLRSRTDDAQGFFPPLSPDSREF
jgi:phage regulator Rha-like protein